MNCCHLLVVTALAIFAKPAFGEMLEERDWRLITSDNFRVHTVLGNERTTELLRQLEVMRVALGDANDISTFQANVPTVIIALDNDEVHGVRTILHEYVHYLHRKNGRIVHPKWYEEGTAEYLSSSRVTDESFDYGLPITSRLSSLTFTGWLPMKDLLELSDLSSLTLEQGDLFYSQAWLPVHYLNNQPDSAKDIPGKLQRYGELVVSGADHVRAFEKAFSLTIDGLDEQLLKYLLGNDKAAEEWFTEALSNDETRPRAEAGLGTVFGHRGQIARASARFEAATYLVAATEQSPTDQASRLLLANAYHYAGKFRLAIEAAEAVLSLGHEKSEVTIAAQEVIKNSWEALDWQD